MPERPEDGDRIRSGRALPSPRTDGRSSAEVTRRLLEERRARAAGADAAPPRPTRDRPPRPPRERPRTARGGGGRGGDGGRGGRHDDPARDARFRRRRLIGIGVLGVALVALWFLFSLFQPLKSDGEGEVAVTIANGSGIDVIGDQLEGEGVISSAFFFEARARLGGVGEDLKSGEYVLREDMSYGAALDALSAGPPPPETVMVAVPEGLSRFEIAPLVEDAGLEGDYEEATVEAPRGFDPSEYGAEDPETLEGFLFPATYELEPEENVEDLVQRQLDSFEREFEGIDMSAAEEANLTPYDVLIIASLVEREAQVAEERPLVAGVIYNRLADGEPLFIDATTRFETQNWDEPLVESELAADTPYNTRLNAGLPPGPIGNPGTSSLEAAANPEETEFRYYVVKPGSCGEHEFNETLEEHEADVAEYNSARDAAGGQSPVDC